MALTLAILGLVLVMVGMLVMFSAFLPSVEWGFCVVVGFVPICGASSTRAAELLALASLLLGVASIVSAYLLARAAQRTN